MIWIFLVILTTVPYYAAPQGLVTTYKNDTAWIYDTTGWKPGNTCLYLDHYDCGGMPYVWQGEESIDFIISDGLLYVNGLIRGVNVNIHKPWDLETVEGVVSAVTGMDNTIDLCQLPHLAAVEIAGNWETSVNDNQFQFIEELTGIIYLDLLAAFVPDSLLIHITNLPNLRYLVLGHSTTDTGLAHIKDMKKLRYLYLTSTPITDDGMKHLAGLTNLRTLILGGWPVEVEHRISDKGLVYLSNLTNLRELDISVMDLTDTSLALLSRLVNLRSLRMVSTNTTDTGLVHLASFPNLRRLDLCGNYITDAGLVHLMKLKKLEWLNVGFTDITDQGLVELVKMPGLKKLIVWGYDTPLTWEGLDEFRKLRPDCELLVMDFWPD